MHDTNVNFNASFEFQQKGKKFHPQKNASSFSLYGLKSFPLLSDFVSRLCVCAICNAHLQINAILCATNFALL